MSQDIGAPEPAAPDFSRADVARLFAGTYLPLCRDLHGKGAIDATALARRIEARLGHERQAPWAVLALSIAQVLMRDAESRQP